MWEGRLKEELSCVKNGHACGWLCGAKWPASGPPDRTREYTARRRSSQRSGWLRRSSQSHSARPVSGCRRSHRRRCRSKGTCKEVQGAHSATPWDDSSVQSAPFQTSVPHGAVRQNHPASALHTSQRPPAALVHPQCVPAPTNAQASSARPPASAYSARADASQRLRSTGYCTGGAVCAWRLKRRPLGGQCG